MTNTTAMAVLIEGEKCGHRIQDKLNGGLNEKSYLNFISGWRSVY